MKGPNLRLMAWRNLWRNRRRTLVTLSSIAFGVLLATLFTGMADWRWTEVINLAAKMGAGHVTLQHPEYNDKPSLSRTVRADEATRAAIAAHGGVEHVAMRISGHALLATAGENVGAFFLAFDAAAESPETLALLDKAVEGEMFASSTGAGIILGRTLAETLGTRLGRKVVYTMTDKDGEIVTGLARVSGIVRTGAPGADARLCLLPIDTVREALGYGADEGTQVAIFLDDHRKSEAVAADLGREIGGERAALTWAEVQPDLAGFIALKVYGMLVTEVFVMILIAAGIFNTLFVSVMERVREFGILMAIGFSPGTLFRLVVWESVWLGLVGIVLGAVVTALPYHLIATRGIDLTGLFGEEGIEVVGTTIEPVLRVDIYPENAVAIAILIVLATVASGLYPAWRAGRVVPVESIKLV